ncbi:MAG TPA: YybS family protein [Romboutsia timonensis]|uniref:YybS family protein n=1 Tax=Romboutsia timonensis TaxID=1776391 RepID=A0A921MZE6_9FIRM|nr:DUF2232 domain-containing protein [uncultured Romboutsia sp.]HJG95555.1 YybS family protein [Romboutsia timonensis]
MNNKLRLAQASLIAALGILLCLITAYVPILSILSIAVPVPYAIIATLTDNKYSILSLIATFFILMFTVNPLYSVSVCIMSIVPGIFIGSALRNNKKEGFNKFEPIYIGTIITMICVIVFFFIGNIVFKTNILEDFMNLVKESVNIQITIMENTGIDLKEGFKALDIVNYINNMLPTMLFLQGMIVAFIIYSLEIFILKRVRIVNLELPKLLDFYLPGNAISVLFTLYIFVLFMDLINLNLHTDLIMMNLQLVFNFMFMLQGIAVSIYFFKKWIRSGSLKMIFMSALTLSIFGFMGISFVGMLDSIIDFRRVRSYKST